MLHDEYDFGKSIEDLSAGHDHFIARIRRYLRISGTCLRPHGKSRVATQSTLKAAD
jgi:hypothetical protein